MSQLHMARAAKAATTRTYAAARMREHDLVDRNFILIVLAGVMARVLYLAFFTSAIVLFALSSVSQAIT